MDLKNQILELKKISLSMFRKNLFGVFHGSISSRVGGNNFVINKQNAIFDDLQDDDFTLLSSKKDYRWNDASIDSSIHYNIYKNLNEAKFICYTMPHYVTSYSINHNRICPKDYFGNKRFGEIFIYDPKQFDNWYERADTEIYRHMIEKNTNIIVIKGYGVYAFGRTLHQLAKDVGILEKSCQLLKLSNDFDKFCY